MNNIGNCENDSKDCKTLSLQGLYTVIGHSVVISDKHAPKHRGDRMACATYVANTPRILAR